MSGSQYLNNQFLIAMPALEDPNFSRSVTYICQHNESGALGITINRTSGLHVSDVLSQLGIEECDPSWGRQPVLMGGPVHPDRGFVLHCHQGDWNSTFKVTDEISLTTSKDILQALANGTGPGKAVLALGYAGWAPGQLEEEIRQNAWLSSEAESDIIFELPIENRWERAAAIIGIDIQSISGLAGHA